MIEPPDGTLESGPPSDAPALPQPPGEPPRLDPEPVIFAGTGGEYFRIWIVNLALSVITLGIYSPWAKVRRLQYFYRHTRLAGSGFDYHGQPIALLKGRIIAVLMIAAYYGATAISPITGLAALAALALALPWLIVRSLRFRCHNSSYRGIRFRFHGATREGYWVYLILPVLSIFTLFLLFPFAHQRMRRYQQNNISYGTTRLSTTVSPGEFYIAHVLAAFTVGALLMVAAVAMVLTAAALAITSGTETPDEPPAVLMVVFLAVYAVGLLLSRAILQARLQNAVWSASRLGPHGFLCHLGIWRYFAITATNVLATVATLGLFLPFAQVRLTRYMASRFRLYPGGPLDEVVTAPADEASAVGDEAAEMFDIDIAF